MWVLSTKTLSAETMNYAQLHGFEVMCLDFIATQKTDFSFPDFEFDALVFTSENAVKYFAKNIEMLRQKKQLIRIFSLSGKTNEALQKHNVQADFTAENAELLAKKIVESKVNNVLHICGNLVMKTLQEQLQKSNINYEKLIVYETALQPKKVDTTLFEAILFFSPSGVESFFSVNEIPEKTICTAIGKTTEKALKTHTKNRIITAEKPSVEAMFEGIAGK